MAKYRTQILLEPEQYQALANLAEQRQESISHVVREILQEYLVQIDDRQQQRQAIEAIQGLAEIREKLLAEHGMLDEDFLEQLRQERADDLWDGLVGR